MYSGSYGNEEIIPLIGGLGDLVLDNLYNGGSGGEEPF